MPSVRNLRKLKLSRVDLVPKGSNPGAHIAFFKDAPEDDATETNSPDSQGQTNSKENPMSQTETTAEVTEAATAEVENTEVTEATTTEATEATTDTATEAATEATPELVAAGVEKSEPEPITKEEAEAIRKENAELRADVEKMAAEKRKAEFIAKAEKDFGSLGNSVAIGEMLMKAEDAFGESEVKTLNTMLKALTEQAETGDLFAQFGKAEDEPTDREAQLETLAKERVEKGESPTIQQARVAVMDAHPELRPDNTTARS